MVCSKESSLTVVQGSTQISSSTAEDGLITLPQESLVLSTKEGKRNKEWRETRPSDMLYAIKPELEWVVRPSPIL